MTVLTSSPKPAFDQKKESSGVDVRLNVTGVDVKGLMFRHPATVLKLDGRDCVFRSESEPELDGSVLAEFNYEGARPLDRVTQARVKSSQADSQGGYKVAVELEFAQTAKVNLSQAEARPALQNPVVPAVPPAVKPSAETKIKAFPVPPPTPWGLPVAAKITETVPPQPATKTVDIPATQFDERGPMPKISAAGSWGDEEKIRTAVASEIEHEMSLLKDSMLNEVEKALPSLIASKMEKMIRDDVEKQIQSKYESSMRSLQEDVKKQVQGRLADSPELQALLQNTAKRFFEENAKQFQSAGIRAEEEISSRAAATMRPFEESLTDLEAKMNASRSEMELAAMRMQSMKQEMNEGMLLVQEALQQLRDAENPGIEKMQDQAAAQLREWSTQFDNLLNKSATEKAIQFSLEMERRMAPHRQRADESVEKLGAMLQLLQGTARVQQERLNEHSIAAAANFEKQIKALLVRLGSGA